MKLSEFFLGTPEEKAAQKRVDKLTGKAAWKKLNARNQKKLEESIAITRRRLLRLGGIGLVGIAGGGFAAREALKETNEIQLGNVRFYLEVEAEWSREEKEQLFEKITNAYNKLAEIFGPEMVGGIPEELAIEKNRAANERGAAEINSEFKYKGVEITMEKPTKPKGLSLTAKSESTIFHELFHALIQRGYLIHDSFFEGHAHALQLLHYQDSFGDRDEHREKGLYDVKDFEQIQRIADLGLDFNKAEEKIKGGVRSLDVQRILRTTWERQWADFAKDHPNFLPDFYKALRVAVEEQRKPLDRKLVLEIAASVEPEFASWHQSLPSMRSMNNRPSEGFSEVVVVPRNRLMLINMRTHQGKLNGNKVTPAYLGLNIPYADYTLVFEDDQGNKVTKVLKGIKVEYIFYDIPAELHGHTLKSAMIGNINVPISIGRKR